MRGVVFALGLALAMTSGVLILRQGVAITYVLLFTLGLVMFLAASDNQ